MVSDVILGKGRKGEREENDGEKIISILLAVGLLAGTWDTVVLAQDASFDDAAEVTDTLFCGEMGRCSLENRGCGL